MKQETLNIIANIDENTIILPKSEGGVYEMYQLDSIADLRKASRNFMRTEKRLESLDAKTSAASELVAGIVTEARIKEISKALDPIQATELVAGIIKISTTSQVATGTDDTTAVTPYKLKEWANGTARNLLQNGYIKHSDGIIEQWGINMNLGSMSTEGTIVSFPITFPNKCISIVAIDAGGDGCNSIGLVSIDKSKFKCWSRIGNSGIFSDTLVSWRAIGY